MFDIIEIGKKNHINRQYFIEAFQKIVIIVVNNFERKLMRYILYGNNFSGKTFSLKDDKVFFVSVDGNAIASGFTGIDVRKHKIAEIAEIVQQALDSPKYDGVVLDAFSQLVDKATDETIDEFNKNKDNMAKKLHATDLIETNTGSMTYGKGFRIADSKVLSVLKPALNSDKEFVLIDYPSDIYDNDGKRTGEEPSIMARRNSKGVNNFRRFCDQTTAVIKCQRDGNAFRRKMEVSRVADLAKKTKLTNFFKGVSWPKQQ